MADVLAVRDDYRAQTWRMLIQECSNSGLRKREFCRRRGISEKSFYYWLRKLRSQMAEAAGPQIVQLESSVTSTEILQIQYRGAELKLPVGVDIEAVAALLRPFNRYDRSDKSPKFLYCLRLYRSPSWDRQPCRSCEAAVWQSF